MLLKFAVILVLCLSSISCANNKKNDDKRQSHPEKRSDKNQKRGLYGIEPAGLLSAPPLPSFASFSTADPTLLEVSSVAPLTKTISPYPEVFIGSSPKSYPVSLSLADEIHSSPLPPVSPIPVPAHDPHAHIKEVTITKEVPVPYLVHVEKKIPYPVYVQVPHPYPVTVEKHVPYEVRVPVEHPVPYPVPKPYPVTVEKHIPVPVEKRVPYPVKVLVDRPYPVHVPVDRPYPVQVPVDRPYPVHVPVEKPVPYAVDRPVPYPVHVAVDRPVAVPKPYPVTVEKRIPYPVEKPVLYAVEKPVPYAVKVPVAVEKHYEYPIYEPAKPAYHYQKYSPYGHHYLY